MHTRPLTLDEFYRWAREQAFQVAPRGCSCTHTTKLSSPRGHCLWCNAYWAGRLRMEGQEAVARAKALGEHVEERARERNDPPPTRRPAPTGHAEPRCAPCPPTCNIPASRPSPLADPSPSGILI